MALLRHITVALYSAVGPLKLTVSKPLQSFKAALVTTVQSQEREVSY